MLKVSKTFLKLNPRPFLAQIVKFRPISSSEPGGEMSSGNPVESTMREKLKSRLNPTHLEILNESYMHNVPKGSETHFKVVVVSNTFENKSLLQRHRMVNEILEHELKTGVHALSINAKTPSQWESSTRSVSPSPKCRGGFGK